MQQCHWFWAFGQFDGPSLYSRLTTSFNLLFVYFSWGCAGLLQIDYSGLFLFVLLVCYGCSAILCKIFWEKLRNQIKLNKTEKLWYLVSPIFWAPVPNICFCSGDWTLGCIPWSFEVFLTCSYFWRS